MTNKRGSFPFANAPYMTGAQQLRGLYPVPFFYNQLMDAFENIDSYGVSITCVPDVQDADIALVEAGAIAAIGGISGALLGIGLAADWLIGNAGISIEGATTRQACPQTNYATQSAKNPAGLPYQLCRDLCYQQIFAKSLCLVIVDFGATVRTQAGQKTALGDFLYWPQITCLTYLGGYFISNDLTLLQGAGQCFGGITFDGSEGTIGFPTALNCLTSAGPPVGQPSLIGEISTGSRYDALTISMATTGVKLSGVPFTGIPALPVAPNEGLFFGDVQTPFKAQTDGSIIASPPPNFRDYLTFRGSAPASNLWTSRTPVTL